MANLIGTSRGRYRRLARYLGVITVAATVPAAVLAAPAYAAGTVFKSGTQIIVNLSNGMSHTITVGPPNATTSVTIASNFVLDRLTAGSGCSQGAGAVICPVGDFDTVVVNGADRADVITKTANVRGDLRGGAGDDQIESGPSPAANVLDGGPGADILRGGNSQDVFVGGPGSDTFIGGLNGNDIANYLGSSSGVVVSLDDTANDGALGEGDNVHSDVESVFGSQFADTIKGSVLSNRIAGFGGNDDIRGSGGTDSIDGGAGRDILVGDDGNDSLFAMDSAGGDFVDGTVGFDTCQTDVGDTRLSCEG